MKSKTFHRISLLVTLLFLITPFFLFSQLSIQKATWEIQAGLQFNNLQQLSNQKKEKVNQKPLPTFKPNSISVEIGGAGLVYSINYDRVILYDSSDITSGMIVGIGFARLPQILTYGNPIVFPIPIKFFKQWGHHSLEVGGAFTPIFSNGEEGISLSAHIGYKFTFHSGFYAGLAFTPLLNEAKFNGDSSYDTIGPVLWAGLRIGHSF